MAIAVKPVSELGNARTIEKLQLEKAYWEHSDVEWKLFTDREVSPSLKDNLLWIKPVLAGPGEINCHTTRMTLVYQSY